MNIQDVSQDAHYAQMVQTQKTRLEAARARRGERPTDRKTRRELVEQHMMQYEDMIALEGAGRKDTYMRATMIGDPYLPSLTPLAELKKIMINELALETHHRGSYLLLRLFVPPIRMTALITLAEDETGDALTFSLYQQEAKSVRHAAETLRKDSVLLLKEPYFKCVGDGGYGLRVDHPTDIVWLSSDNPIISEAWRTSDVVRAENASAEGLKQKGNAMVQNRNFSEAIKDYTAALGCSPSPAEAEIIHNNRALAYLKLQRYDAALEDTSFVVDPEIRSEKALYRGSLALYSLGRYRECLELLHILTDRFPTSEAGNYELSRVRLRIKEQETGVYNFKKMYKAAKLRPPLVDCATFVGPVEVRHIKGKGRGLFTTKDIKAGELLFCEKAFSYAFAEPSESGNPSGDMGMLVNLGTNRVTVGTHVSQLTDIYQMLEKNPSGAAKFLDLYSGSYARATKASVDGLPIVDSFLIERIVALNVFGSPITSKDVKNSTSDDALFGSSGVWIQAAYINHSCMKNCARTFIGDMMIVRATKDIPANTELGWCYADPMNRAKMQKSLQDSWGFKCSCAMCQDDARTSKKMKTRRKELVSSLSARDPRQVAVELEKTYLSLGKDIPRFELFQLYFAMAQHMVQEKTGGNPVEGVSYVLKALEALGFVVGGTGSTEKTGLVVKQWGYAAEPLADLWEILWTVWTTTNPKLAKGAKKWWKLAYTMVKAGESETFEEMYGLRDGSNETLLKDLRKLELGK